MLDIMQYNTGTGHKENWVISESRFDPNHLGKAESIFALGNGYMGLRSAMEESYPKETRNLFVAGTFNKYANADNEVTELPNATDVLWLDLTLDGEPFNLKEGQILAYNRSLDLKDAQLVRDVTWQSPKGKQYHLVFSRFVSMDDRHVIGIQVRVKPLSAGVSVDMSSGLNARMTNSGAQHFIEGQYRFYDQTYMQLHQTTNESGIDFVFTAKHGLSLNGQTMEPEQRIMMDRRRMYIDYSNMVLDQDQELVIEKLVRVATTRDKDHGDKNLDQIKSQELAIMRALADYDTLLKAHIMAWETKVWDKNQITITSKIAYDQLAMRFAIYHLHVMTPAHDNRMNIGAKGLSGEGYKGHAFWDTEIFILPYFMYSHPETARKLLEYRYLTLPSAHKKAKENGYEGAMFPWESAWLEDGEVTPVWGAADIVTGQSTKIWTGFIEYHITSDVAFATWQYYQITGDEQFMEDFGYELILDTAKFWSSRLEPQPDGAYHINNVIGPDEYKEHVNNNAFTNYMAQWNIRQAMNYYEQLQAHKPALFEQLNTKLGLATAYATWAQRVDKIYLPQPNADQVIPQDDTYLSKEIIDLTKYKNQVNVGSIYKDYSQDQINAIQVSKQADIMVLFLLLEDRFNSTVKAANWNYYEPKTLHDSSLSLSSHSILANDMKDHAMAYGLFQKACNIDLGPNMKTSDAGIHAASLGGIWQCVVLGFGGVRMLNGHLRISPRLPEAWEALTFRIHWKGDSIHVHVTQQTLTLTKVTNHHPTISLEVFGVAYELATELVVTLSS